MVSLKDCHFSPTELSPSLRHLRRLPRFYLSHHTREGDARDEGEKGAIGGMVKQESIGLSQFSYPPYPFLNPDD